MSFVSSAKAFLGSLPIQRFHPVTLDALRHYDTRMLTRDISAGLTVGMVALPLAMAFGVSSGADAASGLVTAIVAGIVIGILSGASYQISGPTGAMAAILLSVPAKYGIPGVLTAGLI